LRYFIHETDAFREDLRRIDGGSGVLLAQITGSLYHVLERNPRAGWALQSGLWVLRRRHLDPLGILVSYFYRIDDEAATVTMVGARLVTAL
jgi:hypothetical protein